jgi:hypothetical protein
MEDVNIPSPNPFIAEWLVGPIARSIAFEAGELYEALYREVVAKRTGRLAASTHVSTDIGGDRWVGFLTVTAPYAASHEFGTDDGDERIIAGHHDLNRILDMMSTL